MYFFKLMQSQFKYLLRKNLIGIKNQYLSIKKSNIIFIHIPKVAGTAISKELYGQYTLGHLTPFEIIQNLGLKTYFNSYRFCFVRDPIKRFESAFYFLANGGMNSYDKSFFENEMERCTDINLFIETIFSKHKSIQSSLHFKPQINFIFYNKKLLVNFIGRHENLKNDLKYISRVIGKDLNLINENINFKKPVESELNSKSILILKEIYKQDYKLIFNTKK